MVELVHRDFLLLSSRAIPIARQLQQHPNLVPSGIKTDPRHQASDQVEASATGGGLIGGVQWIRDVIRIKSGSLIRHHAAESPAGSPDGDGDGFPGITLVAVDHTIGERFRYRQRDVNLDNGLGIGQGLNPVFDDLHNFLNPTYLDGGHQRKGNTRLEASRLPRQTEP